MKLSGNNGGGGGYDSDDENSRDSMSLAEDSGMSLKSMAEGSEEQDAAAREFYANYELSDILGRGMASTVRRAIEKKTKRNLAVKIMDITAEHQTAADAKRLFEETIAEVAILRELQGHPCIIALHDYSETASYLFLVFEMAPYGELFDVLTKEVTFSEKRTKRCMKQIFEGLQFMHDKNIVHRDMKLENILCITKDKVVLTDFGLAVKLQKDQKLRELCGTPGYLAPETLKASMDDEAPGYDLLVDLWACGVIMFTLLAGNAPFYHRQQMRMLRMIQEARYEFKPTQWDNVGNDAKHMIKHLLVVDRSQRLTAQQALAHPFIGSALLIDKHRLMNMRRRLQRAIFCVRFLVRLTKLQKMNREIDRDVLLKRPFRDRQIKHETEATVFLIYGHWVQKGFNESREMLFANQPRPKRRR